MNANRKKYYKNGKQIIFHCLGTGLANLQYEHLAYIEQKIDELKNYARNTRTVKYYDNSNEKYAINIQNANIIADIFTDFDGGSIQL